jgi:HNH endonuclease
MFTPEQKLEVWRRDKFQCVYCGFNGKEFPDSHRHLCVDHWTPRSKGGLDTVKNGRTSCWSCNSAKAGKEFDSEEDASLWCRIYKEVCLDEWYKDHIAGDKDLRFWNGREKTRIMETRYANERIKK